MKLEVGKVYCTEHVKIKVLYTGEEYFFFVHADGQEDAAAYDCDWVKELKPFEKPKVPWGEYLIYEDNGRCSISYRRIPSTFCQPIDGVLLRQWESEDDMINYLKLGY